MSSASLLLPDPEATWRLGHELAALLGAGDLVVLSGDLGAGKTTLVQGIGHGLGVRGQVSSPTFIIARSHPGQDDRPALVHVDAYRLESLAEVDDLDLETSLEEAVTVVEWGRRMVEALATDRLDITLTRPRGGLTAQGTEEHEVIDAGMREARLRGTGPRWQEVDLPAAFSHSAVR